MQQQDIKSQQKMLYLKIVPTKFKVQNINEENYSNTRLAAKGALAHRLQRLQNPIWLPGCLKIADGV